MVSANIAKLPRESWTESHYAVVIMQDCLCESLSLRRGRERVRKRERKRGCGERRRERERRYYACNETVNSERQRIMVSWFSLKALGPTNDLTNEKWIRVDEFAICIQVTEKNKLLRTGVEGRLNVGPLANHLPQQQSVQQHKYKALVKCHRERMGLGATGNLLEGTMVKGFTSVKITQSYATL